MKMFVLFFLITLFTQTFANTNFKCGRQLQVFLALKEKVYNYDQPKNLVMTLEKFKKYFPIERRSLAYRNPEMLYLAIELMNFKQVINIENNFKTVATRKVDEILEGYRESISQIENRLRTVLLYRDHPDDWTTAFSLDKAILEERQNVLLNDLWIRYRGLTFSDVSDGDLQYIFSTLKSVGDFIASKGAEMAISFTKNDRIQTGVSLRKISENKIIQIANYQYQHKNQHLMKEIDIIFYHRQALAEVKYYRTPIGKNSETWNDILNQFAEYLRIQKVELLPQHENSPYEIVHIKKIELYVINGIYENAARTLEQLGIFVYGPRIKIREM